VLTSALNTGTAAVSLNSFVVSYSAAKTFFCSAKDKTEKRLLGFSFTPLMDQDGTVLPDGQLQLLVYKCEDAQRLRDVSSYLDLPYSVRQLNGRAPSISGSVSSVNVSSPSNLPFQRNVRESVTVAFYLCSTKLTQNGRSMAVSADRNESI